MLYFNENIRFYIHYLLYRCFTKDIFLLIRTERIVMTSNAVRVSRQREIDSLAEDLYCDS